MTNHSSNSNSNNNNNNNVQNESTKPECPKSVEAANGGDHYGRNSYTTTLFHILAVSVGPIVFTLPCAFSLVGYATAIAGIAIVGLVYAYNLRMFLKCCAKLGVRHKIEHLTFAESVRYSLEDGPPQLRKLAPAAGQLVNALMLLTWGGELSFNVIFVCGNLRHLVHHYTNTAVSMHLLLACGAVPCILISSVPNLRLSFLSMVAGTIDLLFLGVVLFELYFNPWMDEADEEKAPVETLQKLPNFLAAIFFTLNFTGVVLPLKHDMKNASKFDSRFGTLTVAIAIICAVDVVFGLLGYLRYGNQAHEMITYNLPQNDLFLQIMIGLYCLAIYFTYPVYFLVVFRIVWDEWFSSRLKDWCGRHWSLECATRVAVNLVIFALISVFPQISIFTNIGGLICAIINSLIIPSLVQILMLDDKDRKSHRTVVLIRNLIFLIVGTVLLYFGVVECIKNILQVAKGKHQSYS